MYAIWAVFFFSFLNTATLAVGMAALLYFLTKGRKGYIQALVLLALRTPMSPAVAVRMGPLQIIKWGFILGFSALLLFGSKPKRERTLCQTTTTLLWVFTILVSVASLIVSSYPTTSIFKVVTFALVFHAVLVGVSADDGTYNFADFVVRMSTPIIFLSLLVLPFGRFRIINGSFQGILNHPNMMGIMLVIYISYCIHSSLQEKWKSIFVMTSVVMIYFTGSRTSLLLALVMVILSRKEILPRSYQNLVYLLIPLAVVYAALNFADLSEMIRGFVYKGNEEYGLLYSRYDQYLRFLQKFNYNPLLGGGFGVPLIPGIRINTLVLTLIVEPGNIIWAVLGDCGILGFLLFALAFLPMVLRSKMRRLYLFIGGFGVSMGEMVFFSTNNIAVLCYLLLALYAFDNKKRV